MLSGEPILGKKLTREWLVQLNRERSTNRMIVETDSSEQELGTERGECDMQGSPPMTIVQTALSRRRERERVQQIAFPRDRWGIVGWEGNWRYWWQVGCTGEEWLTLYD